MPSVPLPKGSASLVLGLFFVLAAMPSVTWADEDASEVEIEAAIEELFLGELVFPQDAGELQATLAGSYEDETTAAGLTIEWGWTDAWQLELELDGVLDGEVTGLGRVEVGGRYSALDLGSGFHLAAGIALGFTTKALDDERARNAIDLEPTLVLARDFADGRYHGFLQVGVEWNVDEGDRDEGDVGAGGVEDEEPEDALEAVVGGYAATPWGAWTLELAFERELEDADETEVVAALGGVLALGDGWELGAAGFVGLSDDAEDGFLLTLTVER